ncbi:NADP-dependent malic enzyme [Holospora obtusa F1]|uniref:NADP-dependent malic enzyme n=1 Tax=Holospora obtusa F1 TaxID=1399147 RepID=W6TEF4_HOLOB|nr:malic enzyme-like NAD(P)-binding protein [Holospora obtusa]ETZ07104.1 NADP-dependent malic enzyme [Holospora obtusa F1]
MKFKVPSLHYHAYPKAGKWEMIPSKSLKGWRDFALAYNPGVAFACEAIVDDPHSVYDLTNKGHLVAVITNGTAVLGMGDIGPLAAKPVMEGKSVLIKYFSGLDSIDLELAETDPYKLIEHIAALAPSFGAINLEDIKAPECFIVEQALIERLTIPVFHDDQHGTAIVVCAAVLNGLYLKNLSIEEAIVVVNGAGAGALACLSLLCHFGLKKENIWLCDQKGVVYKGREHVNPYKAEYAQNTCKRTLSEALQGADVFLGLSKGRILTKDMLSVMSARPLIFALANPVPEIFPEEVYEAHPDALVSTGRSDYPNQINNILCFPYMFKGALAVRASCISQEMKKACVQELENIAREGEWGSCGAYEGELHSFGSKYFIPKAFDPRLRVRLPMAIAQAAVRSGVAFLEESVLLDFKQQLIWEAYSWLPTFCRLYLRKSFEISYFSKPFFVFSYDLDAQDRWKLFKSALLALQSHDLCTVKVVHPKGGLYFDDSDLPHCGQTDLSTVHLHGFSCLPGQDIFKLKSELHEECCLISLLKEAKQDTKQYLTQLMKAASVLYQSPCELKDLNSSNMIWSVPLEISLPCDTHIYGETLYIHKNISFRDMIELAALVMGRVYEHNT